MTFDQFVQLFSVIGGIAGSVVATLRGFHAVSEKLKNYVTVEEYRVKVATLHGEINALKIENAGLKRDVAHLMERK